MDREGQEGEEGGAGVPAESLAAVSQPHLRWHQVLKTKGQEKVWKRVATTLSSNGELEGTMNGGKLMTSAGPCTVPSLKDSTIG